MKEEEEPYRNFFSNDPRLPTRIWRAKPRRSRT